MEKKRWIKRGFLWTICLVIMLCAVSAQAMSIPEAVGRWYFVSADGFGLPEGIYVEFNRDRSVTMVAGENTADTTGLTWEIYEEKILIKSQGSRVFSLDYDGTSLTCLTEQLTTILGLAEEKHFYTFTLSRTPNTYDIPDSQPAASEDQFFGEYENYLTVTDGQYIPINSGERTIIISEYVLTETVKGETREYLTDYTNSTLHVYAKKEWIYAVTSNPDILVANLLEDGTEKYRYFRRTGTAVSTDEIQTPGSENDNAVTTTD